MKPNTLYIYLVGYGRAGKIHAQAYKNMDNTFLFAGVIESCEDKHAEISDELGNIDILTSLNQLAKQHRHEDIILDICVPAPQYLNIADQAKSLGITKMIFEKPIGWSFDMAQKLTANIIDCDTFYLDTYRFSKGVRHLCENLENEQSDIEKIHITFNKNRTVDSLNKRGFSEDQCQNAWYIEGPHMVSIAQMIGGDEIKEIENSTLFDMNHDDVTYDLHGGAVASLIHENGVKTSLYMSLISDENVRIVEVTLRNNTVYRLSLPPSKSVEFISHIEKFHDNKLVDSYSISNDRPMEISVCKTLETFSGKNSDSCSLSHAFTMSHGLKINKILHVLTTASKKESIL